MITAYGERDEDAPEDTRVVQAEPEKAVPRDRDMAIDELLALGDASGYAFWFGDCEGGRLAALIANLPFDQLVVMDDDLEAVGRQRLALDRQNQYGKVTVHVGDPQQTMLPSYVGNMMFIDRLLQ